MRHQTGGRVITPPSEQAGPESTGLRGDDRTRIYAGSITALATLLADSSPTAYGLAAVEQEEILSLVERHGMWQQGPDTFLLSELPVRILSRLFAGSEISDQTPGAEELTRQLGLAPSPHLSLFPLGTPGTFKGWLICATTYPVLPDRSRAIRALANVIGASLHSISVVERRSGDHFRALVQNSSDAITVISPDATIEYQTPSIENLLGYLPAEVVGAKFTTFVHPDDVADLIAFLGQAVDHAGATALLEECRLRHKRGDWVHCEISISNLLEHPTVSGFVLNARDVTERRWAQDALEKALSQEKDLSQKLRSVDEMKNTFLAAVSHELRTPLTSILGGSVTIERMLERGIPADDETVKDLVSRVARQARKLETLLSDLLDLNRLVRDAFELNVEDVAVDELVAKVVSEVSLATEVEVSVEPFCARLDRVKIERILENLIRNAGKYTPEGSKVWVTAKLVEGFLVFIVEDEGDGIPDDMKGAIFEPFHRGEQVSTHSPGTGIGLSLVKRFAELHGGRAWVQDREGGGASFRVMLPVAG